MMKFLTGAAFLNISIRFSNLDLQSSSNAFDSSANITCRHFNSEIKLIKNISWISLLNSN